MKRVFYSGGTLGDTYVVACKLQCLYHQSEEDTNFVLYRYTAQPQMDLAIKEMLLLLFPFIEQRVVHCVNSIKVGSKLANPSIKANVISTHWIVNDKVDKYNPFPVFSKITKKNKFLKIGVQLCAGSSNSIRSFSRESIEKIIRQIGDNDVEIYLFGRGSEDLNRYYLPLGELKNVKLYFNQQNFSEWVSLLRKMDVHISLEGFSAFFSMSQKIPTLMYNQYKDNLEGSIHPEYFQKSKIVQFNKTYMTNKIRSILRRVGLFKFNTYSLNSKHVEGIINRNKRRTE
jgi:hypothetical protein